MLVAVQGVDEEKDQYIQMSERGAVEMCCLWLICVGELMLCVSHSAGDRSIEG